MTESTGSTGQVLKDLARRVGYDGPFASVYFDSSHDTEDAAHQIDLRWRAIVDQLSGAGLAEKTLAALDDAVTNGPPSQGRAGRALVATGSTVLIDEQLPQPPPGRITRVSPLPYLLPLIEHQRQETLKRFSAERGRANGLVATGLDETITALSEASVEHLLINEQALADRTVCSGTQPTRLATTESALRAMGEDTVHILRADEVLPIAALAVGAEVVTTDEALPDGVAALLRHK